MYADDDHENNMNIVSRDINKFIATEKIILYL